MLRQLRLAFKMAAADWWFERTISFFGVIALASMLAPILLLQGVRNGVVTGLQERLMQDPSVLVITPVGGSDRGYTKEQIASFAQMEGVRFAIGRTREIATDITINSGQDQQAIIHMEPCAKGEPVFEHYNVPLPKDGTLPELVLSSRAAGKLKVTIGATLYAQLGRKTHEGRFESISYPLRVSAILPKDVSDRMLGFLPQEVLEDFQDYRDEFAVPKRNFTGKKREGERIYASFRLYATDLFAVEDIAKNLAQKGIETRTKARDIASLTQLKGALDRIILMISLAVGGGFIVFTISATQGAVRRKERFLGMLNLLGFEWFALLFYTIGQTLLTAIAGIALALLAYGVFAVLIDQLFWEQSGGMTLCLLQYGDVFLVVTFVFILSILASFRAAFVTARMDPSTVLRNV